MKATMTPRQFKNFQKKHNLSTSEFAKLLLLSKESIYKKRSGKVEITPRDLALMATINNEITQTT